MKSLVVFLSVVLCALSAEIRFTHATPDAPAFDIYINGHLPQIFTNVPFKGVTKYFLAAPGMYELNICTTGTQTPVLSTNITLDDNPYTVASTGFLSNIRAEIFSDYRQQFRRGYSSVRFAHLGPDAPAVDMQFEGFPVLFSGVQFHQFTNYSEITHGDYTLQILLTGTDTVVIETSFRALADVPSTIHVEGSVAQKTLVPVVSRDL